MERVRFDDFANYFLGAGQSGGKDEDVQLAAVGRDDAADADSAKAIFEGLRQIIVIARPNFGRGFVRVEALQVIVWNSCRHIGFV